MIIRYPIDSHGNYLEYITDVLDVDTPLLFGLDMMKKLRWYANEVTDELICHENPELRMPLKYKQGHL